MPSRDIHGAVQRPIWKRDELEASRQVAIEAFVRERMEEPTEAYVQAYDSIKKSVEELFEQTANLHELHSNALAVLTSRDAFRVLRYVPGPPVSEDDLKTLVGPGVLRTSQLVKSPVLLDKLIRTIEYGLDQRRFPWVSEGRLPTDVEIHASVVATTALIAVQHVATSRRNAGKTEQEERVRTALDNAGFKRVPGRAIHNVKSAPEAGEYCPTECLLGTKKADLVVGLWDGRIMPIECKVSNSAVNSFKRLNHEAAGKADEWIKSFGTNQVIPAAVLSGVYSLGNLEQAQSGGLCLFWAHKLSDLVDWIETTK